jgi:hypothetical protein
LAPTIIHQYDRNFHREHKIYEQILLGVENCQTENRKQDIGQGFIANVTKSVSKKRGIGEK